MPLQRAKSKVAILPNRCWQGILLHWNEVSKQQEISEFFTTRKNTTAEGSNLSKATMRWLINRHQKLPFLLLPLQELSSNDSNYYLMRKTSRYVKSLQNIFKDYWTSVSSTKELLPMFSSFNLSMSLTLPEIDFILKIRRQFSYQPLCNHIRKRGGSGEKANHLCHQSLI